MELILYFRRKFYKYIFKIATNATKGLEQERFIWNMFYF